MRKSPRDLIDGDRNWHRIGKIAHFHRKNASVWSTFWTFWIIWDHIWWECYDRENFPRTNNETEGSIRKIKTRYRRISGRKNWNKYLLRHGRNVGFYDWWASTPERWLQFEKLAQNVKKEVWIQHREELEKAQSEQLTRYRFCHLREKYLTTLENQWDAAASLASDNQSLILHWRTF